MRVMKNEDGQELTVTEHIILKNFWEYYVLKRGKEPNRIRFCLVMGVETEMGDVDMEEIRPYVMTRTKDLSEVMPPPGWSWA